MIEGGARPRVLVVAGHDSSGGAGIDADVEAADAMGCAACLAVTARTEQGAEGLVDLGAREPASWLAEVEGALDDGTVRAVKLGLLPGGGHLRAAARLLSEAERAGVPAVLDPVLAPSLGGRFVAAAELPVLLEEVLPTGPILTPNLGEVEELTGRRPGSLRDPEERVRAAEELLARGARAVVVKGGHARGATIRDLLVRAEGEPLWVSHPRVPGGGMRGTGCRHATALACLLARGEALPEAVRGAAGWVAARILHAAGDDTRRARPASRNPPNRTCLPAPRQYTSRPDERL